MSFPSGFLIVDKPSGPTSFSMVSLVRRLTGVRRVGHAGTLDPLASGVLPVAVGQATRLIEYLDDASKVYIAQVRFGVETNTFDADGQVTATGDASGVTSEAVGAALGDFEGEIEQVPPAFSAIKMAGKPLYRSARAGQAVEAPPRRVFVDSIRVRGFATPESTEDGQSAMHSSSPIVEIEVVCSKGTYIRSIARDLGRKLGCGAHLAGLRRTRSGGFGINQACSPEALTALAHEGRLEAALVAPDRAVESRNAAILGAQHASAVLAGRDFELDGSRQIRAGEICRAYDTGGRFLGVLVGREGRQWHPAKVLVDGRTWAESGSNLSDSANLL